MDLTDSLLFNAEKSPAFKNEKERSVSPVLDEVEINHNIDKGGSPVRTAELF